MFKIFASIRKEFLLLINDKVGLILMFVMPVMLVFIITIIQDGAYKVVNENKIPMIIVNHDKGTVGQRLLNTLEKSGLFEIEQINNLPQRALKSELLARGKMLALYIPADFSNGLEAGAGQVSNILMEDLGLERDSTNEESATIPALTFYHDPVLQQNYTYSVQGVIQSYMSLIENSVMIEKMYASMDMSGSEVKLQKKMIDNRVRIQQVIASNNNSMSVPNSTQHNVPAWTIFAMFFMVVSLGGNIVKERVSGSFLRLKTMPTSFVVVMLSKMLVYVVVAVLQVFVTFSIGMLALPAIGLPELTFPTNIPAFVSVVVASSLAAVSYALMIGAYARTQEQANGFGAISIVIFGAIGGILVPAFVMPAFMQSIGKLSPLHWCLEGFYILFLKGGSWSELKHVMMFLGVFVLFCQLFTYLKLRLEKIV